MSTTKTETSETVKGGATGKMNGSHPPANTPVYRSNFTSATSATSGPNSLKCNIVHCLRVLSIFNKLFQKTLRFRDRSVKVIQYGCQMISGYWSPYLPEHINIGLINLRRTASNSRKWFWLLKCIQHIIWLKDKSNSSSLQTYVQKFDYLEQIFLVLYYSYENRVLMSRLKVSGFSEQADDFGTNLTWFIGDLALLFSSSTTLCDNIYRIRYAKEKIQEMKTSLALLSGEKIHREYTDPVERLEHLYMYVSDSILSLLVPRKMTTSGDEVTNLRSLEEELENLLEKRKSAYLAMAIAIFEVGVSAHYAGCFKLVMESGGKYLGVNSKYNLSDGHVGLMGVLSSSLILFQYYRDLPPPA